MADPAADNRVDWPISYVVYRLPDIYESTTLIVVTPSTLPNCVVPTITEETLTRELTSISQVVTSRSSLQPLMEKYDLYKDERRRGEPMELLIDSMRKQIKVEVNTSNHEITNGFNITYRGRDPKSTQAVAAELASKYIDEQTKGTVNAGTSAKQFIEEQVRQAKEELDSIDTQRLTYLQQNMNNLPSQSQALVGRLTALHEGQKALISELGARETWAPPIAVSWQTSPRVTSRKLRSALRTQPIQRRLWPGPN